MNWLYLLFQAEKEPPAIKNIRPITLKRRGIANCGKMMKCEIIDQN